jgi:hypothetical protein
MRTAMVFCIVFSAITSTAQDHDQVTGAPTLVIKDADTDLKSTVISPALQLEHKKDTNLLWSTTVQLAWNELMTLCGGAVQLEGKPKDAEWLNAKLTGTDGVNAESYFARLALGNEGLVKLRKDLAAQFPDGTGASHLPQSLADNEFLAYAYLFRNLAFATPFLRETRPLKFIDMDVASFTATAQPMRNQVIVHDYKSPIDFVIELVSRQTADQLLIARCSEAKSLHKTVEGICKRQNKAEESALESDEVLRIPVLNFELTKNYSPVSGKKILNKALPEGSELEQVTQLIRFRLDEKGAVIKSIAKARGTVGAADPFEEEVRVPRQFICDGPFAILLLKKGAKLPYFAVWVANPELLVQYAPSAKE